MKIFFYIFSDRKWLGPLTLVGFLVVIFVQESRITWYRERLKKSESLIPSLIPTLSDAEFELNESHVTNLAVSTLSDEILQISAEPVKSNVMEMNPETCPIKDNTDWGVKIKSIYRKGCIFSKTRKILLSKNHSAWNLIFRYLHET